MSTANTTDVQKLNTTIASIGDITLKNILSATGNSADVGLLVKSIVSTLLDIAKTATTDTSTETSTETSTSSDTQSIVGFLDSIVSAVASFMSFLDYDGDGSVSIVKRDADNNVVVGDDIIALEKDLNNVESAFKNQGDLSTTILAVLSSLLIYFTNKNVIAEEKKFNAFHDACKNVVNAYGPVKSAKLAQLFKDEIQDIISFVVTLCIIVIPTVELANQKIAAINKSTSEGKTIDPSTVTITNDMINKSVTSLYGANLTYIVASVKNIVGVFVKTFNVVQTVSCSRCC